MFFCIKYHYSLVVESAVRLSARVLLTFPKEYISEVFDKYSPSQLDIIYIDF